jgi:predicted phosphodiesterase
MGNPRFQKFVVASDLHGDQQDKNTVRAFREFMADYKPHKFVFAGDLWDFRPLRKGASDEEVAEGMQYDFISGMEFLKEFKPDYFLLGNHEKRLWNLRDCSKGLVREYACHAVGEVEKECRKTKTNILPYHKRHGILKLGHLKILHGFHYGVYACRKHAQIYGSCLFGHIHAIDEHAVAGMERRVARSIGCMCDLNMEYTAANTTSLRWAHGWAYGRIDTQTGLYHVVQAEEIGGKFLYFTDHKVV